MKLAKNISLCWILWITIMSWGWSDLEEDAMEVVRSNVNTIVITLVDKTMSRDAKDKIFRGVYDNQFDKVLLAQMTLKSDWKKLNDEEKNLFVQRFSEYVYQFYMDKMTAYDNNKIVYKDAGLKSGNDKALVKTEVEYQGAMARVDYSLYLRDGVWKVYDVEVEGVRLTSQYRSQFSSLIKKDFNTLIAELDTLIAKYLPPVEKQEEKAPEKVLEKTAEKSEDGNPKN